MTTRSLINAVALGSFIAVSCIASAMAQSTSGASAGDGDKPLNPDNKTNSSQGIQAQPAPRAHTMKHAKRHVQHHTDNYDKKESSISWSDANSAPSGTK